MSTVMISAMLNKRLNVGSLFKVQYARDYLTATDYMMVEFVPNTHVRVDLEKLENMIELKSVIEALAEKVLLTMIGDSTNG